MEGDDIDILEDLIRSMEVAIAGHRSDICLSAMAFILARVSLGLNETERKSLAKVFDSNVEVYRKLLEREGIDPLK